ncbi:MULTISPECIES: hypothetical protein [unclassified Micromonospora]|uniref:hypothetical protein n=1 Tax=unclassified Micromonospora TaxID=2617518 RepID=UPI002FF0F7AA
MDDVPAHYADAWSADRTRQNAAYTALMEATSGPVPWAEHVWDDLVGHLKDADNHNRAIAAQLLCNLAAHHPSAPVLRDLDALMAVTKDERFVTARHALRSLWKIGLAGQTQRRAVVTALDRRYREAADEKNGTLVRSDIVEGLRHLHDAVGDPDVEQTARRLIDAETDLKYQRKYRRHWR